MKKSTYKSLNSLITIAQHALKMSQRPCDDENDRQVNAFYCNLAKAAIREADMLITMNKQKEVHAA